MTHFTWRFLPLALWFWLFFVAVCPFTEPTEKNEEAHLQILVKTFQKVKSIRNKLIFEKKDEK